MTGIATLTGRFSVAVGTIREASNVIPCIVLLLLAVNPPSPEVVHDRAPVPPGRASWYDHIDTNWPMMFRIASACHSPASRPAPSVQARKRGGYHKNSSTEAKIQNDGNRNVDRTVIGGCRNNFSCGEDQIAIQRFASGRIYYAIVWVTYHRYCTR